MSVPAAAVPVVPEVPSAVVPAVVPEVFPVAAAFSTESPEIVNESTEVLIPASAFSSCCIICEIFIYNIFIVTLISEVMNCIAVNIYTADFL